MKGIGRLFGVGIAKETSRGTAASSAGFWIPFSEGAAEEKDQKIINDQTIGVIEDSTGQSIVKQWSEITIKAPIGDAHFPLLLYSFLGSMANATHSGESAVYDHTITVAESSQHQSLTTFLHDPLGSADYKYANAVADQLEIDYVLGQFLSYSASLKAKKGAGASSFSPSYTAENRFLPAHLTFKLATNLAGLNAASATQIKSLKLTITKNLEDDDVLGSLSPNDFLNKQFAIEGEVELLWNDETFKTLALAATPQAVRLDLVNTGVTIGSASNPELKIDLASVIFTEITRPFKVNDLVSQTLKFKAHYSASDAKMVSILATNTQASY
jgi:hypothetical protein